MLVSSENSEPGSASAGPRQLRFGDDRADVTRGFVRIDDRLDPHQLQALAALRQERRCRSREPGVGHILGTAEPGERLAGGAVDRDGNA